MKRSLKALFAIALLLVSWDLSAQVVSGLKGNRFFVNLAPQVAMLPKDGLGPISIYGEAEYVIKNYKSIVFRGGYSNFSSTFNWINTNYDYNYYLLTNAEGEYVTSIISGSILVKNYRRKRGDLAPLGQYWLYGGKINSTQIDVTKMTIDGSNGGSPRYEGGVYNFAAFVPIVGFGKSSLIAPKLLLNWEINSELDLFNFPGFSTETSTMKPEMLITKAAKENNVYWNILQFKLGLSYAL